MVFNRLAGGIILTLTYGIQVQDGDDPFVNLIEAANENFSAATAPGAFLVDFFPILRRLPEWLPGMGFMSTGRKWAKDTLAMVDVPFAFTKKQMVCLVITWYISCIYSGNLGQWSRSSVFHIHRYGKRGRSVSRRHK